MVSKGNDLNLLLTRTFSFKANEMIFHFAAVITWSKEVKKKKKSNVEIKRRIFHFVSHVTLKLFKSNFVIMDHNASLLLITLKEKTNTRNDHLLRT